MDCFAMNMTAPTFTEINELPENATTDPKQRIDPIQA
jgi:hypothetical protein